MFNGAGRPAAASLTGVRARTLLFGVAALVAVVATQLVAASARAAEPNQVTGLTVTQGEGFATLGVGAGRRRHRLPDRAHAGRRGERAHGRVRDRRRLAAAAHDHAPRRRASRRPGSRSAAATSGASAPAWGRRAQPYSEPVFGTTPAAVGHRPRSRPAHAVGVGGQRDLHERRQRVRLRGGARRRERPRPRGRARPHQPDPHRHRRSPGTGRSTC